VFVDAKTMLLSAAEMEFVGEDSRDYTLQLGFAPKAVPAPPAMLAFDPAGKYRVSTMPALNQLGVGEPVPPMRFMTADGKIMRREHMLGSITVLDFWATWCGPCKRALPLLEKFHAWTEESGQPVKVYAVNSLEKFPSTTQKMAVANNYWTAQQFTMSLLLDVDDSVVKSFGFESIPMTVVIDAEGKVARIHSGYDAALEATLKADVLAILSRRGS
jgi:thiol-disulfide isomerase/thioredoxin